MVATDSDQDSCCARYCLYTVRANCIIKDNKYFTINQIFEALFRFELKPIDYKSIRLTIDPIEPTRINSRHSPYGLPTVNSAPLPQALLALISWVIGTSPSVQWQICAQSRPVLEWRVFARSLHSWVPLIRFINKFYNNFTKYLYG